MIRLLLCCLLLILPAHLWAADMVEFVSGSKLTGTVKQIRKGQKEFDFEAKIGARTTVRTFPFAKVHAVTMNGRRFVLTPKTDKTDLVGDPVNPDAPTTRSKAEVNRFIASTGASDPDWLASTKLDYPDSLELDWPLKPPKKGWNNQRNMGQYNWDIINPNPGRWKSGIKLVYHCMSLHEGQRDLLTRDMKVLGGMYFNLLQDYPRAAYWMQKGGVKPGDHANAKLAECYWRLGNRQMAMQQLNSGRTFYASVGVVKLLGDMGSTDMAIKTANQLAGSNASNQAFLAAGDALRKAGRLDEAIAYYEKVINGKGYRNKDYEQRFKSRAAESIDAIRLFDQADVSQVSDGTYNGSSTGYNGRMDIAVTVADGKIESVKVTQHKEKQFYSALTDTEANILRQQSVRGIDGTTGATITSQAIVNAAARALASAAK